jgi:MoaA/NifB/PqqE/SkfB family radical SAM enzyme
MLDEERYEAIKGFHIYTPSKVLLYMKEMKKKTPVFIELHPSTVCNDKCIWCRYWGMSKKNKLSLEYMLSLFDRFPKLKGVRITGGGEPLTNKYTLDFIEECTKRGIKTSLETNGALFDDKSIKIVGGNCQYCRISLDAATPETYKKVHGKDDFRKVLSNIRKLGKTKLPELGVSYLVTPDNVDEILKLVDLNLPVNYVHLKPLIEGIDDTTKALSLEKIKILRERVPYRIKYDRILRDYYFNKQVTCRITDLIRVIGGDGKEYVCCEHAYEPDFISEKWSGSTAKCKQCRYNPYNEVIDMYEQNTFTKEFL